MRSHHLPKGTVALGFVWYDTGKQRPFYSMREINRGKNKGGYEVEVSAYNNDKGMHLKKMVVQLDDLIIWEDERDGGTGHVE